MIGCSGFSYNHWEADTFPGKKAFYKNKSSLTEYAQHFNFLELNCTFYKTPSVKTVVTWKESTPDGFMFLVKVQKFMTHMKKLHDWKQYFPKFFDIMSNLGTKLAGFLVQLPPSFANTSKASPLDGKTPLERLRKVIRWTEKRYPGTDFYIEFRHPSWFCLDVYNVLRDKWTLVVINSTFDKMNSGFSPSLDHFPEALTTPGRIMFRNHGTWAQPYCGGYSDTDLALMVSLKEAKTIVCFDNTDSFEHQIPCPIPNKMMFAGNYSETETILPHAVVDAKRMLAMM